MASHNLWHNLRHNFLLGRRRYYSYRTGSCTRDPYMKKPFAAVVMVALIGLVMPGLASADTFTFVCDPATETPPPDWFGGPWFAPLKVVIDTQARSVELFDLDNKAVAVTARPLRLAGLNNYRMDVVITDNVINWGVIEMWGFSGYI